MRKSQPSKAHTNAISHFGVETYPHQTMSRHSIGSGGDLVIRNPNTHNLGFNLESSSSLGISAMATSLLKAMMLTHFRNPPIEA
ncbi:hypothetical protein FF1_018373 [Malus domestica]